jgi:C4-dicarboxylate-specific signal transduction histidine kinase
MIIVRIHRDRELQVRTGLQNNDAILVAVEDSGSGFDPKRLGSLYDAVFTTSRMA